VLYFSTYEETKNLMGYHEINNPNPLLPILSGGIARIIAVTAVSPIELVRTKIQSERLKYHQIMDAIKLAVKNQGFISLYRGWVSTVWRDVPFSMIYWFNYESFKTLLLKKQNKNTLDSISTFSCGAAAGSIAAAMTCPLDVVKTYRQIQLGESDSAKKSRKTINIMKEINRVKGFKALFAGKIIKIV
jgi:solute carrier family 25, member 39/40